MLEEYSKKAGRSLEQAVMSLIVGVMAATFGNLDYHEETKGCVMDFCTNREDIIHFLRHPVLEPSCKSKIKDRQLASTLALLLETIRGQGRDHNRY